MSETKPIVTRRDFFSDFLRDTLRISQDIKKSYRDGVRAATISADFEDLPIAQTYPRELFEEEARRLGIDVDAVGETEAIRRIILNQMEQGKA
jgi:hypothetical protein